MVRLLKEEDGWTIITTLLTLPVLICILILTIQIWGVFTIYNHTESLKYNTLSKMEVNGGLTQQDKMVLEQKLIDRGADPDTIQITGDILENNKKPVYWPDEVSLRIEFTPKDFDNFTARTIIGGTPGEPLKIGVEGSVVSSKTKN